MSFPTTDSHVDKKPRLTPSKIPTCEEEMSDADRELQKMRIEGAKWPTIIAKWKELTGEDKTKDSLSKRHNRMMTNFKIWPEGHAEALIEAKEEIEANLEKTKWTAINDAVHAKVGVQYGIEALKKKFTQLEKNVATSTIPAIAITGPDTPNAVAGSSSVTTPKTATPKKATTSTNPKAKTPKKQPATPKAKAPAKSRTKATNSKAKVAPTPITPGASVDNEDVEEEEVEDAGTMDIENENENADEEGEDEGMTGIDSEDQHHVETSDSDADKRI